MVDPAVDERARAAAFVRLSSYYAASFAVLGVYMQFFPRWLNECRGCTPEAAAFVLSGQIWARTLAGPLWSQRVDRGGAPRPVLIVLSLASLLVAACFAAVHSQVGLFCVCVAFGCVYPPIHPILDSLALGTAARWRFAYGSARLVGSCAFLVTILAVGAYLRNADASRYQTILWGLLGGLLAMVVVSRSLPQCKRAPLVASPVRDLLRNRRFLVFLAAAGLIQASHAAYYSLSTNDWHAHGIDELTSGMLWAEGILAEIVLFFVARRRLAHLRPTTLMLIGGGAAVVRWCCLASTRSVLALFALNWLHAATFAGTFLGSIMFIQKRVPEQQQATAQGLLAATSSGACMALATMLAGLAYRHSGGGTYLAMAGLALCGGLLTWALRRRPDAMVQGMQAR